MTSVSTTDTTGRGEATGAGTTTRKRGVNSRRQGGRQGGRRGQVLRSIGDEERDGSRRGFDAEDDSSDDWRRGERPQEVVLQVIKTVGA
jgi:hypothetical protein